MEPISEEEKQELRAILSSFYGNGALSWRMTKRSFELFGELISKTSSVIPL